MQNDADLSLSCINASTENWVKEFKVRMVADNRECQCLTPANRGNLSLLFCVFVLQAENKKYFGVHSNIEN